MVVRDVPVLAASLSSDHFLLFRRLRVASRRLAPGLRPVRRKSRAFIMATTVSTDPIPASSRLIACALQAARSASVFCDQAADCLARRSFVNQNVSYSRFVFWPVNRRNPGNDGLTAPRSMGAARASLQRFRQSHLQSPPQRAARASSHKMLHEQVMGLRA